MQYQRNFIIATCFLLITSLATIIYAQSTQAKPDAAGLLPEFNRWRTAIGIRPYQEDIDLSRASQFHSDDQVARNYFAHTAPSGVVCNGKMVTEPHERSVCFGTFGGAEGITSGGTNPDEATRSWLSSYGHCTGVMNPDATHMGGGQNGTIWTFMFNGHNEPDTPVDHEAFCRCTSSGNTAEACVTQFNDRFNGGATPVAPPPSSQQVTQRFPGENSTYSNTSSGGQCCIGAPKPGTITIRVVPVNGNPSGIVLELADKDFEKIPGQTGTDTFTYTVEQPGEFSFWFDSSKIARGDTFYIETFWEAAGTSPDTAGSADFIEAQYSVFTVEELIQAIDSANSTPDTMETILILDDLQVSQPHNSNEFGANAFPIITSPITIVGTTRIISRDAAAPPFRFFYVDGDNGNRGELFLQDIFLEGGTSDSGGAIFNNGGTATDKPGLTLTRTTFTGNTSAGNGGAIFNNGFGANNQAYMTISDSLFRNNTAAFGGAIYNGGFDGGYVEATLTAVEFTDNTASIAGNAIYNNGQGAGNAAMTLTNVLINRQSPTLDSGDVFNDSGREGKGTVTINNSEEG